MSESSATNAFEGVTLRGVIALVQAIQASSLGTEQQIKKVFARRAEGYEPALRFCERLGIARMRAGSLTTGVALPSATSHSFREHVLRRLLRARNRYRSEVFQFLRRFDSKDGEVSYATPVPRRSLERACRNFLMEAGVIRYRADRREHVLSSEGIWIYAAARESSTGMSPAALEAALRARSELGHAAEVAVMDFEKCRVGAELADRVEHVALMSAAAGYDISSVTSDLGPFPVPRYIEVKAVSASSFGFYWSRNEVEVAKAFGQHYYLYLVPVSKHGEFDLSALRMIADPHDVVLASSSDWMVEADVLNCQLTSAAC